MKAPTLTPAQYAAVLPTVTTFIEDWVDRECTSFDTAVQRAAGAIPEGGGSIWDVPRIDSKRTVSLLTGLEPILGVQKLPATFIKKGGYSSVDDLKADLLPRLEKHCTGGGAISSEKATPAAVSAAAVSTTPGPTGMQ